MANGADGSIIIDTQLDNSGFERGSKKMNDALSSLEESVSQLGSETSKSVNTANAALQELGRVAQASGDKFQQSINANNFAQAILEMQKSVSSLAGQLLKIGVAEESGIRTDSQFARLQMQLKQAESAIEQVRSRMETLGQVSWDSDAMKALQEEYDALEARLRSVSEKIQGFRDLGFTDDLISPTLTQEYAALEHQLDQVAQRMWALEDAGGAVVQGASTNAYADLAGQIEQLAIALEAYQAEAQAVAQARAAEQAAAEQEAQAASEATQNTAELGTAAGQAKPQLTGLAIVMGSLKSSIGSAVSAIAKAAKAFASFSFNALRNTAKGALSGIKGLVSGLKNLITHGKQATLTSNGLVKALTSIKRMLLTRLKSAFISEITKGIKTGIQDLAKYSSAVNTAISSVKNSMTALSGNLAAFAGTIITAVAPAIVALIDWLSKAASYLSAFSAMLTGKSTYTVAQKGTEDYAKSLEKTKKSAGGAAGAVKDLKNEVYGFDELNRASDDSSSGGGGSGGSSADDNGIQFVEKSLSTLPNGIAKFMNDIKSAFDAGEFAKVGNIAASGLNLIVDKVNVWISGTLRPAVRTWTSNITQIINGFAEGLDWSSVGGLIGNGFMTILDAINTFTTELDIPTIAAGISEGLNGLLEALDFTEIGETIGAGFANIWNLITEALAGFDWVMLGTELGNGVNSFLENLIVVKQEIEDAASGIASGINSLMETINWDEVGGAFANGFNLILAAVTSFVETIDIDAIVTDITTGINSLISDINLDELGSTIGKGFEDLHTLFWGSLAAIDWPGLGAQLATSVNSLFASINWLKLGAQVGNSLKGALNGLAAFLANVNWQQIGTDAANFLAGIDWGGLLTSLGNAIGAALGGLAELLWGFIKPAWETAMAWWKENIATPISEVWNDFKAQLETGWNNISSAVTTFLTEAWNTITGMFGTLGDVAAKIWDGFLSGIQTGWNNISSAVTTFLTEAWSSIVELFGTLGDVATKIWDGFLSGIQTGWDTISSAVTTFFTETWSSIVELFGTLGDVATKIWDGFLSGIQTGWDTISGEVGRVVSGAWDTITGIFTGLGTIASDLWEGFKTGLAEGWTKFTDGILQPFRDMWQAVKDFFGIASPSTEAASIGDFILQGLISGFESAITGVIDTVKRIFGRIWDAIKSIFGFGTSESDESKEAKEAGKDIMTGMQEGITGDEDKVKTAIKETAKHILQTLRAELGIPENGGAASKSKSIGQYIVDGVKNGIEERGISATFTNAANTLLTAVKNAMKQTFGVPAEGYAADAIKFIGEGLVYGVRDGIMDAAYMGVFETIASGLKTEIIEEIKSVFGIKDEKNGSATQTKEVGTALVNGIRDGIKAKAVEDTFKSASDSIRSAVESAMKTSFDIQGGGLFEGTQRSTKFEYIGMAVAQGIAQGITGSTLTIKNAAIQAAQAAYDAACDALGIASPSRVFAELGGYIVSGWANGMNDDRAMLTETISGMAGAMAREAENAEIAFHTDQMTNGLETAANHLDRIANTFAAISRAIANMGGLNAPAVATGAFTPYRVRVDDNDYSVGTKEAFTSFGQNFDETMSDQRDVLRDILNAILNLNLNIDAKALERSLTTLQRDRIRGYGGA